MGSSDGVPGAGTGFWRMSLETGTASADNLLFDKYTFPFAMVPFKPALEGGGTAETRPMKMVCELVSGEEMYSEG